MLCHFRCQSTISLDVSTFYITITFALLLYQKGSIQSVTDDKRRCILIKFTDFNIYKICQINKKALFLHSI